jgi:hypothetical protein
MFDDFSSNLILCPNCYRIVTSKRIRNESPALRPEEWRRSPGGVIRPRLYGG